MSTGIARLAVLVLAAAAVAPSPALAEWPFYGRDLANTRSAGTEGPTPAQAGSLPRAWRFDTPDGDVTGTPVVADGRVVAGDYGGSIFALDAVNGRRLWSRDVNQPINGSAAIVPDPDAATGGVAYVPVAQPSGPRLLALALEDGRVLFDTVIDTQTNSDTFGSPVVWDGRVYIGVSAYYGEFSERPSEETRVRGSVVAVDARTGKIDWKTYMVPSGRDGAAVWTTPAIDTATGRLFVGTGNAYNPPATELTDSIVALDARTGAIRDHFQATANDVWTLSEPVGPDYDFGASPNLFRGLDGRRLVGEGQKSGVYWALDRNTLDPVWQTRTGVGSSTGGIIGSTAYDGSRIYGPNNSLGQGGQVWALNRRGEMGWISPETGPLSFSPVSVANGVVYNTDFSTVVTAREAASGLILGKLQLGAPSFGGVSIVNGALYVAVGTSQNGSGAVIAFGDTSRNGHGAGGSRKPRLRLTVRPRRIRAGRRRVFRFRVTRTGRGKRRRAVPRALVRFAGRRARTRRSGRARIVVRLRRTGRRRARASKRGYRAGRATVRVLRRR
jgi:polyvinyl alcohol dehydrogenase (cytochrome)